MNKQDIYKKKPDKVSIDTSYSSDEIHDMIEKEAYNNAAARGFNGGHALEDWLAAERKVNEQVNHQATI